MTQCRIDLKRSLRLTEIQRTTKAETRDKEDGSGSGMQKKKG